MPPAKQKTSLPELLTVRWTLAELPSAQHRAGLAGLVLAHEWAKRQPEAAGRVEVSVEPAAVTLRADVAGIGRLLDSFFAARTAEALSPTPWKGADHKEKRAIEKNGKRSEVFVYDVTEIVGGPVADLDPSEGEDWTRQWRRFVWSTLRGIPATRRPFDQRAAGETTGDAAEWFSALAAPTDTTDKLASSVFLGAQDSSAEGAPFRDRTRFLFLLHFWPFAVGVYQPRVLDRDGKPTFQGFAVAIPEVSDLALFVDEWPQIQRGRGAIQSAWIDHPAEAGLDGLLRLVEHASSQRLPVSGMDVLHVEKEGNNIRIRGAARVVPGKDVAGYARLRENYRDALFRRTRLQALLNGAAWYTGFDRVFATRPSKLFLEVPWFGNDARTAFKDGELMKDDDLPKILHDYVRGYLSGRLKAKYDIDRKDIESGEKREYFEKRNKIAREAFLAVRARTNNADFQEYFTGSLGMYGAYLADDRFRILAEALLRQPAVVRTLTLLALTANTRPPKSDDAAAQN